MRRKSLKVLGLVISMSLSMSFLSYASQSPRWHEQNGVWYLRNEQGTGNTVNSWFQDLDSSWYLLAPGDGGLLSSRIQEFATTY